MQNAVEIAPLNALHNSIMLIKKQNKNKTKLPYVWYGMVFLLIFCMYCEFYLITVDYFQNIKAL